MKKNCNQNDVPQREGQEQSKKLYRSITEQAKRLDDARSCVQKVGDLFTPKLHIQRKKFREYCERLIFSDPLLFGHKGEELLWRKSFYDVVSTAKKFKKREYTSDEVCSIETHINAGVGYYHHYIAKLQSEYDLNVVGLDFTLCIRKQNAKDRKKAEVDGVKKWAEESVHRCLIYLGDLCRYKLDIYPNWDSSLAIRYYSQALFLNSEYGMPHNQMGTLASAQNRTLDAVYHYMHCLACKVSFEGTQNNLQRLFEKNSQYLEKLPQNTENSEAVIQIDKADHIKQMLARLFLLIDIWYFDKSVPHIYNLCHKTYIDLEECLSFYKPISSESDDTEMDSVETDISSTLTYLTNDSLFKIVIICLLCISKLQKRPSNHLSTVIAFTLAVYSQLVQNVITHIQQAVLSFPLPEPLIENNTTNIPKKKSKKKKTKLRRRRKSVGGSESELSEDESVCNEVESSSDESLLSDNDLQLASSSDEELENDKKSDELQTDKSLESTEMMNKDDTSKKPVDDSKNMLEIIKKSKLMEPSDMLEIILEEGFLQSIKIVNDWLMSEEEVLRSCSNSSGSLLRQITHMLNLLNINFNDTKMKGVEKNVKTLTDNLAKIGLPEDIMLKGVEIFSDAQKDIAWNNIHKSNLSNKEECIVRVLKIISFGKYLATVNETGIKYDGETKLFSCDDDCIDEKLPAITFEELEKQNGEIILNKGDTKEFESKNGQLIKMKHMGQLWLAAEVRALESRVKGKASYSPYLVLDADALIKHTFMVKHLVNSRKFIIIVPSAVVSVLDDLKREKLEARDAIRWLESQFHQGNRFFRAQRPHERTALPFIKYPKKKDKAAFVYIQIIECCHYFAQQQKGASNLVTLLMGNQNTVTNGENKDISYIGLAKSAGVQTELITQFYSKWKKAAKGKR